jgi:hypothetical protein
LFMAVIAQTGIISPSVFLLSKEQVMKYQYGEAKNASRWQ